MSVEIITILLLILLNGVFAMSEIAVVSARRTRLEQMSQEGSRGAKVALELADAPNRFLSTVQVGITLVGVLAGAFGGATIAGPLADALEPLPLVGRYANAVSLALVVGTTTYLSVVVGELVPKRLALQGAERIASIISQPMHALSVLAGPVVHLLSLSTDAVLALLGVEASPEEAVTEEEIKVLIEQSARAGAIAEVERDMVESIFRLDDRPLEAMMTPRPEIVWLDTNASQEEIREMVENAVHSRFPVCDGDLDHVLGVAMAKDLLSDCLGEQRLDLATSMKEPLFVPETARVMTALERFRNTGIHIALVVDEYGGIEGLITLFDVLEAIVGDIPTVQELTEPLIVEREEGSWLVDGLMAIDEFKQAFDIHALPGEGKYNTLGGFVIFMIGSMPTAGAHFGWGGFRFEVADMDGNRVDKVLLEEAPEGEGAEEEGAGKAPPA